ncbi:unannotated protein [freshwater metagenome]|uniref:Unannotated protein n=1 Tax=freshwater metagenome TaxID=449393 RepID=A0A6J7G8D1_9ZZZZ
MNSTAGSTATGGKGGKGGNANGGTAGPAGRLPSGVDPGASLGGAATAIGGATATPGLLGAAGN